MSVFEVIIIKLKVSEIFSRYLSMPMYGFSLNFVLRLEYIPFSTLTKNKIALIFSVYTLILSLSVLSLSKDSLYNIPIPPANLNDWNFDSKSFRHESSLYVYPYLIVNNFISNSINIKLLLYFLSNIAVIYLNSFYNYK